MEDNLKHCEECQTSPGVEILRIEEHRDACEIDEGELLEVAVIEEYVKIKTVVPLAHVYRLKLDKVRYDVRIYLITGQQILALADKTPDKWKLYQHKPGQQPIPVGSDEIVDLRTHGIERFSTMAKDSTEGEENPRRAFTLPEEDITHLDSLNLVWETMTESGQWLVIHDWSLPPGYSSQKVKLALNIPPGYPDTQIDMVYVFPHISRLDGKAIGALSVQQIGGQLWQRWSRHRTPANPWRPGVDDVSTHLTLIDEWFRRELAQ